MRYENRVYPKKEITNMPIVYKGMGKKKVKGKGKMTICTKSIAPKCYDMVGAPA